MKKLGDFWIPDGDTTINKGIKKFGATNLDPKIISKLILSATKCFVDVGANVGYWTKYFSEYFESGYSFEPDNINFACLEKNTSHINNVTIFKCALGERIGVGYMKDENPKNCGQKHLDPDSFSYDSVSKMVRIPARVDIKTLDSYEFECVNLLKIDTEGYELGVLKGAEKTILRCKPIIVVEYTPNKYPQTLRARKYGYPYEDIPSYLESLGLYQIYIGSADLIYGWKI